MVLPIDNASSENQTGYSDLDLSLRISLGTHAILIKV